MKNNKILWIDDYPSPVQNATVRLLRKRFKYDLVTAYIRADGRHENREWQLSANGILGEEKVTCALHAAIKEGRIVIFEPTLSTSVFFIKNSVFFNKATWLMIGAHLRTAGMGEFCPKNVIRKLIAYLSVKLSCGHIFLSSRSRRYYPKSSKPQKTCYGTLLLGEDKRKGVRTQVGVKKICLVGYWNSRKNFDLVVDAVTSDRELSKVFEIHHFGKAEDGVVLKYPSVKFHGYIKNASALNRHRRNMHVAVLVSTREPWGHVVIENMAMGLLTITSDHCGSSDVNSKISKRLVLKEVTRDKLVDAIKWFDSLRNKDFLRMRMKGIKLSQKYTVDRYAKAIDEVLQEL